MEGAPRIFEKHHLDIGDLFRMREASAGIHRLRDISVGRPYTITLDPGGNVLSLAYHINDREILRVVRSDPGYRAEKLAIEYDRRIGAIGGVIRSHLVSSLSGEGEAVLLAIQLSDIFSWDVDFNTDFRKGDTFRILVEEHWLDGEFRKYGDILAAELFVDSPAGPPGRTGMPGTHIPRDRMADFRGAAEEFARSLSAITTAVLARADTPGSSAK